MIPGVAGKATGHPQGAYRQIGGTSKNLPLKIGSLDVMPTALQTAGRATL